MFCYSTGDGLVSAAWIDSPLSACYRMLMTEYISEVDDKTIALDHFLASVERNAYRIAIYSLHDHQQALDVVQDSMLKLVEKYRRRSAELWPVLFYRILRNRITDVQRSRSLHDRLGKMMSLFLTSTSDDATAEQDLLAAGVGADGNPPSQEPERQLLSQELGQQIETALELLTERQRQTFILREWQGLSVRETAEALGCSSGSVKQHHFRALQSLRRQLTEHHDVLN